MSVKHLVAIDRELAYLQERAGAPKRPHLGCSTIAHDRLGFCAGCVRALRDGGLNGWALEATCWQLLALRDQSPSVLNGVLSTLARRLAVAFTGYYDHENGVVPEPTEDSLLWADDFLAIVARAGLVLVEASPVFRDLSQTYTSVDAEPDASLVESSAPSITPDLAASVPDTAADVVSHE